MESNQSESKENLTTTTSEFPPDPAYPPSSPPPYSATNYGASDIEAPSMPYPQPYPPPANGNPQPYPPPAYGYLQPYPPPPNGFPQPYPPPPTAPPYYTPLRMANPGQSSAGAYYGPSPTPPQQQQQQVVFVTNPTVPVSMVVPRAQTVSLTGAIVMSCIVTWLFGWLCGGIAFILAVSGQSSAAAGDTNGAIRLRNASYAFSAIGILLGIAAVVVIVVFSSGSVYYNYNSYYSDNNGYYRPSYYSGYNGYYSTIGYYTYTQYKICFDYYLSSYIYYYTCMQ